MATPVDPLTSCIYGSETQQRQVQYFQHLWQHCLHLWQQNAKETNILRRHAPHVLQIMRNKQLPPEIGRQIIGKLVGSQVPPQMLQPLPLVDIGYLQQMD